MRVGLVYIDSIFKQEEIEDFHELLNIEGIEFRTLDKKREITANIEDLNSVITIMLDFVGTSGVLVSIGASAAWDGIKSMVKYVVINTKGKKFLKVTSKKVEEKDRTISITTRINNKEFHFSLDGLKSAEEVDLALERLLPLIEKQFAVVEGNNEIYIAKFDKKLNEWATKNFLEEIRKNNGL